MAAATSLPASALNSFSRMYPVRGASNRLVTGDDGPLARSQRMSWSVPSLWRSFRATVVPVGPCGGIGGTYKGVNAPLREHGVCVTDAMDHD